MIQRVLVVCIGNICRSPMAEGLFKHLLPNIKTSSAGMMALVGHGADPIAVQIMSKRGIDISAHRARMLTEPIIRDTDLILVMDTMQRHQLLAEYPYTQGKVFRLGETADQDISDPYLQGPEAFQAAFSNIESAAGDWVKRIKSIG